MKKGWMVVFALAGIFAVLWAPTLFAQWGPDIRLTYDPDYSATSQNNAWNVASSGDIVHAVWADAREGGSTLYDIWYKRSTDGGVSWSEDRRLSDLDLVLSRFPAVAISGPFVHVVWIDDGTNYLMYRRSTDYGATWDDVNGLRTTGFQALHPSMVVHGQFVHVVWEDCPVPGVDWIHYLRSTDDGSSFGNDMFLSDPAFLAKNPTVAVSGQGQYVHVAWDAFSFTESRLKYRRSATSGFDWEPDLYPLLAPPQNLSYNPSLAASGNFVHAFYRKYNGFDICYRRSEGNGGSWDAEKQLTQGVIGESQNPNAFCEGDQVHLVWSDSRTTQWNIFYKHSPDNGREDTWGVDDPITTLTGSDWPSVASSSSVVHVVWTYSEGANNPKEIYYKRNPAGTGFFGFKTDSSNGRHLVRDPSRGHLHMVMTGQDGYIYYSRSTDDGLTWPHLAKVSLSYPGLNPTIGLANAGPEDIFPPQLAVCVVYYNGFGAYLYFYNTGYDDPGMGQWLPAYGYGFAGAPGSPSLVTIGSRVYVAYRANNPDRLACLNFYYNPYDPYQPPPVLETIDSDVSAGQPSLAVDGNGFLYAAWKRQGTGNDTKILFAPRGFNNWASKEELDPPGNYSSGQPFIECYGDSAFVVWSEGSVPNTPSDIFQAKRQLVPPPQWYVTNVSYNPFGSLASESPSQAWREFTTWSEGTGGGMFDINWWKPFWGSGAVEYNPTWWSYWPHSQMRYTWWGSDLISAWTESPNPGQPPFSVLTKLTPQGFLGGDGGSYYSASAGGSEPSPYLKKRDGVLRFGERAVDFARDSLLYELPYLDPMYDYYVKVASYRETGNDWAQALSVDGVLARSVRFAPNRVDTAWVKVPPVAYRKDRKVTFSFKNVKGDYVTSLGLTLYQRDPLRGKGGGQAGELAILPVKEVFTVYPNPMDDQAQIEYSLKAPGKVSLSVYDVMGRLVRKIVNDELPAGVHRAAWDGKAQSGEHTPSGVYMLRLSAPGVTKTTKVITLR